LEEDDAPQPRLHRDLDGGMAASVGRLRPCSILDYKFSTLSHNTLRGAAGGALLLAELAVANGMLEREGALTVGAET
jgi:aspartate-semialdehyde dehydrogenase